MNAQSRNLGEQISNRIAELADELVEVEKTKDDVLKSKTETEQQLNRYRNLQVRKMINPT